MSIVLLYQDGLCNGETYSLGTTDVISEPLQISVASDCEQHFPDYGRVAKGRTPLNAIEI